VSRLPRADEARQDDPASRRAAGNLRVLLFAVQARGDQGAGGLQEANRGSSWKRKESPDFLGSVRGWGLANRDAATASRSAPRGPRRAVIASSAFRLTTLPHAGGHRGREEGARSLSYCSAPLCFVAGSIPAGGTADACGRLTDDICRHDFVRALERLAALMRRLNADRIERSGRDDGASATAPQLTAAKAKHLHQLNRAIS
jgi:hypothetical protein